MIYFNEFEPFAAEWLGNLYPKATIDERSITDVRPDDLAGFRRVHFFGGIGGWELALQLAGWPGDRPVWTGSCPCQPYSAAGKQKGDADERDLWPEMFRLIRECRPECIFGEQVPNAIGHGWLDGISADLEREGYTVGAVVLGAHSVGAPHKRNRLFWCAYAAGNGRIEERADNARRRERIDTQGQPRRVAERGDVDGTDSNTELARWKATWCGCEVNAGVEPIAGCGDADGLGNASIVMGGSGSEKPERGPEGRAVNAWSDYQIVSCKDGKFRRVGRRVQPVVAGIPRSMGQGQPELRRVVKGARANRVGRLKGYGNAIVPQVAAVFIRAFMESLEEIERENHEVRNRST